MSDRVKYLLWIYDLMRRFKTVGGRLVRLSFVLPTPVGEVALTVRSNGGSDAFVFSEVFEHRYYDLNLVTPPQTILDAGANVGFATIYLARKFPEAQLACIEPIPENVEILRANVEKNGISARIFAKALTVTDGPISMQRAENDYGHKVADLAFGRKVDGNWIAVDGISVSSLMAQMGWNWIGLLKLDIEGYEGVLLRENVGWLNRVDAIFVECHEGFNQDDLGAATMPYGFQAPQCISGNWLVCRA